MSLEGKCGNVCVKSEFLRKKLTENQNYATEVLEGFKI